MEKMQCLSAALPLEKPCYMSEAQKVEEPGQKHRDVACLHDSARAACTMSLRPLKEQRDLGLSSGTHQLLLEVFIPSTVHSPRLGMSHWAESG